MKRVANRKVSRGAKRQDKQVAIQHPELVEIDGLKPHPKNYRKHPEDQLEHIAESLREHGLYRNVVVARDMTILAGHGLVEAAKKIGMKKLLVLRLDVDPGSAHAIKILTGDNEIAKLAEIDDRLLTEMLKEISETDASLLGTGYDKQMLAALAMVTRPASEIKDESEAAHWVGMPEFGEAEKTPKLVIQFRNEKDRAAFVKKNGLKTTYKVPMILTCWWPDKRQDDLASVRFQG